MKRTPWLKYLPVIVACSCFAPVALTHAYPADPVQIAQSGTDYDSYMRLGYSATAKRDYPTALLNFKKAQNLRPNNRYASNAVSNVSSYIANGGESKVSFVPPNLGAPASGTRQGGATRGRCLSGNQSSLLTALVPATNQGMTTAEYPVLFFYVPQTAAKTLEFSLLDKNDKKIYQTTVAPSQTPGIVGLNLSSMKGLKPLESGKDYHWFLTIVCDAKERSADIVVDGWVQRTETDPVFASELKKIKPRDRVSLYTVNGLWYDALATLSETRQSNPNNAVVANEWTDLLKSVGLEKIAKEPLIPCCTVRN